MNQTKIEEFTTEKQKHEIRYRLIYHELKIAVRPLVRLLNKGESICYKYPDSEDETQGLYRILRKSKNKKRVTEAELILALARVLNPIDRNGNKRRFSVDDGAVTKDPVRSEVAMIFPYAIVRKTWRMMIFRSASR